MALFHHDPLDDTKEDIQLRIRAAENVWNSTYRQEVHKHEKEIREAIEQAEHDLNTFERDNAEPIPPHLRDALELEIHMWTTVSEYASVADLRNYTALLLQLVKTEQAILSSCLTRHYAAIITRLRGEEARLRP
jgi:hypothetical protein